ncbi:cytochrome P450 [Ktedonospora formicarum]|uniref:Putative cytochrome P450 YjiB n=1 Tax=Ktedonospora formicarum TaxID=2778364 RepID=A0A8J3I8M1_9CHLR|nr:cytochrome P450 [Ktedonospora formicarum]GHO48037.1 putative cytochrome P450 YjiB [Ktedonospora formicarum]
MSEALGVAFDPLAEDPYPFYTRARHEEPIMYSPELDAWIITRYKDIQQILLQPAIFSSSNALTSPVVFSPRVLEELIKGYLPVPIVLNTDGADHTRFRQPLIKAFAPSRIRKMEPFVFEVANRLVDTFIQRRQVEIISQFAYPLALEVVLSLLGIPSNDIEQTRQWSQDWLILMSTQIEEERQIEYARGTVDFQRYLAALVAERRREPKDDLISTLIHFEMPEEEPLEENELVIMLQGLILAGHESTTNMIGTGLQVMLEQPEHWTWLREHPQSIPQVVEEILRYDAPIQMFARTTTREVIVDGVILPEEASLLLLYGSGNRDEAAFHCPHEFQPQRTPNHHLAFGHGVHFCVGAALARLEGRIAFEVLSQRIPQLRIVPGQHLTHIPTLLFRGYEHLKVEWT